MGAPPQLFDMLSVIPFQKSLLRQDMLWGCERRLVLVLCILVAGLTVGTLSLFASIVGVVIWIIGYAALRKIAKADPQMSMVYLRHIRYRRYYPPRADIAAPLMVRHTQTKE